MRHSLQITLMMRAPLKLLDVAKKALAKYYKENKLPVLLGVKQGPDIKRSEDAAPEVEFSDNGQRFGESKGIVVFDESAH